MSATETSPSRPASPVRRRGESTPTRWQRSGSTSINVRERLEETFGPGALEQTRAGCLGIMPRLKMALACAVDYAEEGAVQDEHALLGLLSIPDSLAVHILSELGVTLPKVEAIVARGEE